MLSKWGDGTVVLYSYRAGGVWNQLCWANFLGGSGLATPGQFRFCGFLGGWG